MDIRLIRLILWLLIGIGCSGNTRFLVFAEEALQPPAAEKKLIIALQRDMPPYVFITLDGRLAGLFVDLWRLWEQKTGRAIEFYSEVWPNPLDPLIQGKADIHGNLLHSADQSQQIVISQPLYEFGLSLFYARKFGEMRTIADFSGQKVGVNGGVWLQQELQAQYPAVTIVRFAEMDDLLQALRTESIPALIGIPTQFLMLLRQLGLPEAYTYTDEALFVRRSYASVLKEQSPLIDLVDRGFNAISHQELADIERRWVPNPENRYWRQSRVRFSQAEEAWLQQRKTVPVSIPTNAPPLMFLDENQQIQGMIPDYLKLIQQRIGVQFKLNFSSLAEMETRLKEHKTCVYPAFIDFEAADLVTLTDSCFTVSWVIVNRVGNPFFRSVSDLKGMKVALLKDIPICDTIMTEFPMLDFHPHDNPEQALKAVSAGKLDAYIGSLPVAAYMIQQHQIANIKIAGPAGYEDFSFRFAVRNDCVELLSILNKTIHSMTTQQIDEIFHRWLPVQYKYTPNWKVFWKTLTGIGLAFGTILLLALMRNRRLKREIDIRRQIENSLRESEARFRQLVEFSPDGIIISQQDQILYVNPAGVALLGAGGPDELVGRPIIQILPPGQVANAAFQSCLKGESAEFQELRFQCADGRDIAVEFAGVAIMYQNQPAVQVFIRDITPRKLAEEQIQASLKEKEVLLREIHHRVKNNLMVVTSLIQMQAEQTADDEALSLFRDLNNRVMAMTMVHEDLYRAKNLAEIDFEAYLSKLIIGIRNSFARSSVMLKIKADDIRLEVEQAIPCGLIVAELVTNALKYAFPAADVQAARQDEATPEIRIEMRRDKNQYRLLIADNGQGLSPSINWRRPNTLGLELVQSWARHNLRGKIEMENNRGATFIITFAADN